jgi:preprotein translocase subunit YajC
MTAVTDNKDFFMMGFMVLVGFMVVFVLVILRDLARLEAKRNHLFSKLHGRLSSKYMISQ